MKKYLPNILSLLILSVILVPFAVAAQTGSSSSTGTGGGGTTGTGGGGGTGSTNINLVLQNPFKVGNSLLEVMTAIIDDFVLPVGGIICVLAFIFAGFKFVTAQGNETKIKDAKRILTYTAIATALILGADALSKLVQSTVNQLK